MKVENQIFYQIARERDYKVGDKLHFGEQPNGQTRLFDVSYLSDEGILLHKAGFSEAKKFRKNRKLIKDMALAISNYDFFMREIALENVRKEHFPNQPSRFRCMFLSDEKSIAEKNFRENIKSNPKQKVQLIKVRVTGEAFYIKDENISREGLSFNEYQERAFKFWSQKQNPEDKPHDAVLFVGDVEIVEILGDYQGEKQ